MQKKIFLVAIVLTSLVLFGLLFGRIDQECIEDWHCTVWGKCVDGIQTRNCTDFKSCGTGVNKPVEILECEEGECTFEKARPVADNKIIESGYKNPVFISQSEPQNAVPLSLVFRYCAEKNDKAYFVHVSIDKETCQNVGVFAGPTGKDSCLE
jgi:hypothetical protein